MVDEFIHTIGALSVQIKIQNLENTTYYTHYKGQYKITKINPRNTYYTNTYVELI